MTYLKFISKAFQRSIAYKLEYYVGLMNAFLYIFIFTSVWQTVSKDNPNIIPGWTGDKLVIYAIFSTLIKVSFGRNESIISAKVKSGDIIYDILKPFSFVLMYFSDCIGVSLFQLFARAIPLLIFSFLFFGIVPDVSLITLFKFIPVYIMSFTIFILIGFLISSLAFFFTEVFSFYILYSALVTFMSGSVIPLSMFPEKLVHYINYTPFPYLFYYPTVIILELPVNRTYSDILTSYFAQILSVGILSFIVYWNGKRKLEIAGG